MLDLPQDRYIVNGKVKKHPDLRIAPYESKPAITVCNAFADNQNLIRI